jgi:subtilisin-like proprotein convertase family protein
MPAAVPAQTRASSPPKPAALYSPSIVAAPENLFSNSAPITINDLAIATPYPSAITVSGLTGTINKVTVRINGFTHSFPDDVGMVLVGPTGAALLIQDGAGDDPDMNNVTYLLADSGATQLPNLTAWTSGVYKPTTYYTGDTFPAPGPGTTYGSPGPTGGGTATFASVFNGTNPNGTWSLYVRDFTGGDSGSIAGGWDLGITTTTTTAANVAVSGRVLDARGSGVRGARVSFTDSNGTVTTALTNAFGYYTLTNVPSGSTLVANVSARGLTFTPRVVQVFDQLADVNFTPQ